jgi:ureidoglycolate lyase
MSISQITAEPLTKAAFSAFGDVIERDPDSCFETNDGEVLRHHDLADVQVTAEDGRPVISLFQVLTPATLPFRLRLMERHPISSQAFIPLDRSQFLVVVAPADAQPVFSTLRGFIAQDGQGINLHVGVWHHPLIALNASDFLVVDRTAKGTAFDQDYEEVSLEESDIVLTL